MQYGILVKPSYNLKVQPVISFASHLGNGVLNSYGMLFFSKNKVFSWLVLLVSFFTPFAGASGFAALVFTFIAAYGLGFSKEQLHQGIHTYSVLLFALGFATNFEYSLSFVLLLFVGALLTFFIAVALNAVLNKKGLPALSLAFIISTGLIIVASKSFEGIGLTHRQIYWYNETYALGGIKLVHLIQEIENWNFPDYVGGFFRSISAILFQVNIATGIILAIGLLIYSRIAFSLMVFGYTVAILFSYAMGGFTGSNMGYYNMGTNFMLVAVALGGFFVIPSLVSFLWVIFSVPIAYLLVAGLSSIMATVGVPIFSLPFCVTVILFLYILQLRARYNKLVPTPIQYYSPEVNLYRYINGKERLLNQYYHQLSLPFMGEWMVSQGYDGSMTHKGEWGKALDFVILDDEMKTYRQPGNLPEHFYCYNKPVLCPADGFVEEIIDYIEDNEIGDNNAQQNWGNTIIIKHAVGLYTKLSHLKKQSFKVSKGAYVKKGDLLAHCGNSGRSPEPHLHFQVQATPYVGSKTLEYPLAYFNLHRNSATELKSFVTPKEGSLVSNVVPNVQMQQAFNFQPGFVLKVAAPGFETEEWEVCTSVYNETYLYCRLHHAFAYFINNGTAFYFTNYFGKRSTLLWYFYLAAYKVILSSDKKITVFDTFPIHIFGFNPLKWLQDFTAPFYLFIRMRFESTIKQDDGVLNSGTISFYSQQVQELFGTKKTRMTAQVFIQNSKLLSFTVHLKNKSIQATCSH